LTRCSGRPSRVAGAAVKAMEAVAVRAMAEVMAKVSPRRTKAKGRDNLHRKGPDSLQDNLHRRGPDSLQDNLHRRGPDNLQDNLRRRAPDNLRDNLRRRAPDNLQDNLRRKAPDNLQDSLRRRHSSRQARKPASRPPHQRMARANRRPGK
jgi:hypothetical protein